MIRSVFFLIFCIFLVIPAHTETTVDGPLNGHIRIHYQRADKNYENSGLWLWDEVSMPSNDWPAGATRFNSIASETIAYADVKLLDNASQIGLLILNVKTGEKEGESRVHKLKDGQNEIWLKENDPNIYDNPDMQLKTELISAFVLSSDTISLLFNSVEKINTSELVTKLKIKDSSGSDLQISSASAVPENTRVEIIASINLQNMPLSIEFDGTNVLADLHWKLIDQLYAYDGNDLGCNLKDGKATLKLWAPRAEKVEVILFAANDQNIQIGQKTLCRQDRGIWSCELSPEEFKGMADIEGYFYQYIVYNPGKQPKKVLDPYARSMAAVTIDAAGQSAGSSRDFIGKAAIIAPEKIGGTIKPAKIMNFSKREDAIIYEVHIRDFTSDPGVKDQLHSRWGTFRAFIDKLPYIKSLGVTHIQLLPVMAWYFGDETRMGERELEYRAKGNNYNWGYDPHNYFSPDGAYSENPENPQLRIAEFKDLVSAIHEAGMGVILDVVYTHMAQASFLNDIVPDYYFFMNNEGTLLGDFGNNLATNRFMAEKLMIDSVAYWFSEFKIDGMRWDMMGDATYLSVQKAFDTAKAINPSAVFIGEGWRTFKGHLEDPSLKGMAADQDWMDKTDNVGVFSDEMRNELKSGFGCEGEPMFLTGGARNIKKLFANIKAQPENTPATAPGDMVQYIEAHDNMPLYDVIAQSIKKDPEIPQNDEEIHQRIRLGNLIILTSQGTAFIHAGQEYGRTKQWKASSTPEQKFHYLKDADEKPFKHPYFIHDSYDSSDAVNMFDWTRATDNKSFPVNSITREFVAGLIALRKSAQAFRYRTKEDVDKNIELLEAPEILEEDLIIAYSCAEPDGHKFYIFVNADSKKRTISLKKDLTSGEILVDALSADIKPIKKPQGITLEADKIILEPLVGTVIRIFEGKM